MVDEINPPQSWEQRVATSRIEGFAKKFGRTHLTLACHAAFPLVLTPDLLYQIWANFVPDAPWESVAQILLSRLCKQVDYEMYEIDVAVRNQLIRQLKNEAGQQRLNDLAEFLLEYIQIRLREDDTAIQEVAESQRWTALAYTKPSEMTYELTQRLRLKVEQNDRAGILQITALLKQIADPLSEHGFSPLLTYAQGVENFARGEIEEALTDLRPLWEDNTTTVSGVDFPVPRGLEEYLLSKNEHSEAEEHLEAENDQLESEHQPSISSKFLYSCLSIIGIGGTGAKCLEAVTHLTAVGLFDDVVPTGINTLFVDPDETNGNLERARNSIRTYQRSFALFTDQRRQPSFMQKGVASLDVWSPLRNTNLNKLSTLFNYKNIKQNNANLSYLFDVLYTQEERETSFDVGFRGRPAIGSAVMSQVDLDRLEEEPWRTLVEHIRRDAGSGGSTPNIILYGSIFGGTGAAGLPTIGRLIANKLEKENLRNSVRLAGVFLLPYFSFTPAGGNEQVYARADQFMLNTEAALRYYQTQAQQIFDTVYILGSQALSEVDFSVGKQSQRNKPHFLEVYAGLAARHFIQEKPAKGSVILISRRTKDIVSWQDFPESVRVKQDLGTAVRFAYVWLSYIEPELTGVKTSNISFGQASWLKRFYKQTGLMNILALENKGLPDLQDYSEQQSIKTISEWCRNYLRWVVELHNCDESVQLFNVSVIQTIRPGQDELSNLIQGSEISRNSKDTIANLRGKLNSPDTLGKGTIGLARTLYQLCRFRTPETFLL